MGDFNACTGKKTPLIVWIGKGGGEGEEWAQTGGREEVFRLERESEDETENTKGRALIRFCEMVGIVPLNGLRRCAVEEGGEKVAFNFDGSFTFDRGGDRGRSLIDYACISPMSLPSVLLFSVFCVCSARSDHSALRLVLREEERENESGEGRGNEEENEANQEQNKKKRRKDRRRKTKKREKRKKNEKREDQIKPRWKGTLTKEGEERYLQELQKRVKEEKVSEVFQKAMDMEEGEEIKKDLLDEAYQKFQHIREKTFMWATRKEKKEERKRERKEEPAEALRGEGRK
uniref:Endonuclease/exonuclease/phosphatase domain-containing protein n=1 Tax=Chromera velia CCMP2878 TaxID=1169474 RepID=A0A0G4HLD4_9ALVE|eukprot:Cvel_7328.t1-p1 / transcript=Cvel_7328.t1 / gene=Cvel_7328 / organism=Chromera_velia_CCMP2878 / gene_product=hypothetical protein / transcript_product=hypothetical protein / location=Cvel_scaffold380:29617-30480(-) / protein_length=288 / sequence_SO=supercontig / SO=protein_coding / is_pseudo=false